MKEIIYLLRDKGTFKKRNPDDFEEDYQFYINEIQSEIDSVFDVQYKEYSFDLFSTLEPDLVICEDTFSTINILLEKVSNCEFANTVLIIDDLPGLQKLFNAKICKPKIVTFDFLYNTAQEPLDAFLVQSLNVYKEMKLKWLGTPILGLTLFKNNDDRPLVIELKNEFKKNGDQVYSKDVIVKVLPEILENVLSSSFWQSLKDTQSRKPNDNKSDLIRRLNALLAKEEFNINDDSRLYKRIESYLDIQERIVEFAQKNHIRLKAESLAAAMRFYELNPEKSLDMVFLKELYNSNADTKKEIFNNYNLPDQPLAGINKYFKPLDEIGLITKEARIILSLIRQHHPPRWEKSIELSKTRDLSENNKKTFLDSIIKHFD